MFLLEKGLLKRSVGPPSKFYIQDSLEVIVIRQLLPGHDSSFSRKKRHTRLTSNCPLDHPAIRLTRMIDKSSYRTSSGVDNHVLVENHKIEALQDSQHCQMHEIELELSPRYSYTSFSSCCHIHLV